LPNIFLIIFCIFAAVALMVFVLGRTAKPLDEDKVARLSSWLVPLVGLLLVVGVLKHYLAGG